MFSLRSKITLNEHTPVDIAGGVPLIVRLATILTRMQAVAEHPDIRLLENLIDTLQSKAFNERQYHANFAIFVHLLRDNPRLAQDFTLFLLNLMNQYQQVSLYTTAGVLSDNSFIGEFYNLVGHKILPTLPEDGALIELIWRLFSSPQDKQWLNTISPRWWYELIVLLKIPDGHAALLGQIKENILKSIVILSYRISGIGLHPELIRSYPQAMATHSVFVAQNTEVNEFVTLYREHYLGVTRQAELAMLPVEQQQQILQAVEKMQGDASQIVVLLDQCKDIAHGIRRRVYKTGISIRLTNMLVRLEQSVNRLELLVQLLAFDPHQQKRALLQLMDAFVRGTQNRHSLRYLIAVNTELVSRKVTENASKVGEHYISTDAKGYRTMYRMGAIGGLLIAFMATLKILGYNLELAPMGRAFLNSMIYGIGFVIIHIIGGTVATKQPAMTAAAIASTISEVTTKKMSKLAKLAELVVDILRTQFIAIMGNITIAMPIALAISVGWLYFTGKPLVNLEQSSHLLHDLNPFTSLALPHAAIAGVYLYISGLIAGYYDNMAVYNKIGERIRRHPTLKAIFPSHILIRMSEFVESNLGALMSNFLFGVFLGSTATIGFIFGLPLDIRHIAFASANLIHGIFNTFANTGSLPSIWVIVSSILGVALIGLVNLMVSFSLALITALRARGVKLFEWTSLVDMVAKHFFAHPSDFFVPRKQPMQYAQIDSDGNMIHDEKAITKAERKAQHKAQNASKTTAKLAQNTDSAEDLLTLPIGTGVLQKGEKLSQSEIEEKKQALKQSLIEKAIEKSSPSDVANKLPK